MRKSIYFRNFLLTAGLVIFSFSILGTAFVSLSYQVIISEKRETMSRNASEIVRSASAYAVGGNLWDLNLRMSITSVAKTTDTHIFIADADGMVVSCSDMALFCPHIGEGIPSSIIETVNSTGQLNVISDLGGFYPDTVYVVGIPITEEASGTVMGYVFVSTNASSMTALWRSFAQIFLFVSFVVLMLSLFLSLISSKRQAKPLNEMAAATRRFAHGEFSARVEPTGRDDEIGQLTADFNAMADSLEKSENLRREFIANISHELKTPMTTITGFTDGILDGTIPPEKERQYLQVISVETKRLSRLVRRMLDISRLSSAVPDESGKDRFDISEVVRRTLLSLEKKITDKGLDVEADLPEKLMMVHGDADSITQVVYNLLDNAIKFSDRNSVISLRVWRKGEKAYVSVKNTGDIIEPEELPLIFDRFHKTDRSRGMDKDGVGLGLYIVKTILNTHGEDIKVRSADRETEFVFTLTMK